MSAEAAAAAVEATVRYSIGSGSVEIPGEPPRDDPDRRRGELSGGVSYLIIPGRVSRRRGKRLDDVVSSDGGGKYDCGSRR